MKLSAVFRGPWTHVFVNAKLFGFRIFSPKIFFAVLERFSIHVFVKNISRSSDYVAPAAGLLQIGTLWTQGLKLSSVFEGMCSLELVEVLDRPNSCFRIFSLKIFRGPRTHGCYFSNFQNCHNCDNCCHRDSYLFGFPQLPQLQQLKSSGVQTLCFQNCHNCVKNMIERDPYMFFVFRIAIIATIDVTRIFQNCHNCDNCGHRDSYISELHESLLLCQRDAILAIFRIAIIATIVVTGIHLCFFHNCNNCCHQESTVSFSELP